MHKKAKISGSDISFGHLFKDNIITAFKNEQNLKVLVHSKLKSVELPGTFPCGCMRCNTCPFVIQTNQLASPIWIGTVDSRYLAPVGSQNSRARVKWFSRYLALSREGYNSRIQDHRPTLPGVYNSHTVC